MTTKHNFKRIFKNVLVITVFSALTIGCSEEPSDEILAGKWSKENGQGVIHFTESGDGWGGYVALPLSDNVGRGLKAVRVGEKIPPRRYDYNYTTRYSAGYATSSDGWYLFRDGKYRSAELLHHNPSSEYLELVGSEKEESLGISYGKYEATFSRAGFFFNLWIKLWNFLLAIFSSVVIILCAPFVLMALLTALFMILKVEDMAKARHQHNSKLAVKIGLVDRAEKSSKEKGFEMAYPVLAIGGVFVLFLLGSLFGISHWWNFLKYYF